MTNVNYIWIPLIDVFRILICKLYIQNLSVIHYLFLILLFQAVGKGARKKGKIKRSDGSFSDASSNSLLRQVNECVVWCLNLKDISWKE